MEGHMVVNGLKKYKGDVIMVPNIEISINILPFGKMQLIFNMSGEVSEKEKISIYTKPRFTNIEKIEILYEGTKEYKIPKTTDGR